MKRLTSKIFLTNLSLPRDNPFRFCLGGSALAPSPCISNNRSEGIPTNGENGREGKIHTKWGTGASRSPKGRKAFGNLNGLSVLLLQLQDFKGTHTHTHTELRESGEEKVKSIGSFCKSASRIWQMLVYMQWTKTLSP